MSNDELVVLLVSLGFISAVGVALATGTVISALGGGAWWLLTIPMGVIVWRVFVGC